MSKRCPGCGSVNEDSRIYCSSCGEPLDAKLRLLKDLEDQQKNAPQNDPDPASDPRPAARRNRSGGDDEDYHVSKVSQEKKSSPAPWIFLLLGILAVAAVLLLLN